MKRVVPILVFVLILLVGAAAAGIVQVNRFMSSSVNVPPNGLEFRIAPGSSFRAVVQQLVDLDVIDNGLWYRLYVRWTGRGGDIQAGEYLLVSGAITPTLRTGRSTANACQMSS